MIRGGATYYYHKDGLGSVTAITDSTGAVVRTYTYKTFGTISEETGTLESPYTYTGRREYDSETGLYYYRARYYDSALGRFIQKDPIGLGGGMNVYAYVGNNPGNYVDPWGEYGRDVHQGLTYFLALAVGFNPYLAEVISTADQGVDSGDTGPFNGNTARLMWHFTIPSRQIEVFNISKANIGVNNLAAVTSFGQALHVLQDSYSHSGWEYKYGHGIAGVAPDNTYDNIYRSPDTNDQRSNPTKALEMAMDIYDRLSNFRNALISNISSDDVGFEIGVMRSSWDDISSVVWDFIMTESDYYPRKTRALRCYSSGIYGINMP